MSIPKTSPLVSFAAMHPFPAAGGAPCAVILSAAKISHLRRRFFGLRTMRGISNVISDKNGAPEGAP